MARTELSMLEALLGEKDRLNDEEKQAFTSFHRKLHHGFMKKLTKPMHEWVEKKYLELELDADEPSENLVSSGVVQRKTTTKFPYELMPRPLKPPGRA